MKGKYMFNIRRIVAIVLCLLMVIPFFGFEGNGTTEKTFAQTEENVYVETFDGINLSTGYTNTEFTGKNGIVWSIRGARIANGEYSIDGDGIILGNKTSDNSSISLNVKGVSEISVELKKAYTNENKREIGIYVDGELKKSVEVFDEVLTLSTTFDEQSHKIEIKPLTTTSKRAQVIVDNAKLIFRNNKGGNDKGDSEDYLNIIDARVKSVEDAVKVKGIITYAQGAVFVIQDKTGGIQVHYDKADSNFTVGEEVEVEGKLKKYNDVLEIEPTNNFTVKKLSSDNVLPAYIDVTVKDLVENFSKYESLRVRVTDAQVTEIDGWYIKLVQDKEQVELFDRGSKLTTGLKIGDTVDVIGVVGKSLNIQIKLARKEDLTIKTKHDDENSNVISIKEARKKQKGETVTIRGIVTYRNEHNVVIQDETAGIDLHYAYEALTSFIEGQEIEVTGTIGEFRGLKQIETNANPRNIKVLSNDKPLPKPIEVTLDDIYNNYENYESQRVLIKGLTIESDNLNNWNIELTDGNNTVSIFDKNRRTLVYKYNDNSKVNVVAVLSKYSNPQLWVSRLEDVEVISEGKDDKKDYKSDIFSDDEIKNEDAKLIPEVLDLKPDTNTTVIGIVTYVFGGGNKALIQDKVNGEIVGYLLFSSPETLTPGDVVVVKGNHVSFYGLPEMSNIESVKILRSEENNELLKPQEVTVSELQKNGAKKYVGEYLKVTDVVLPQFKDGQIDFHDEDGNKLQGYRVPEYPVATEEGDLVDILCAGSKHYENFQIDIGKTSDYIVKEDDVAPFVVVPKLLDAKINQDYEIIVKVYDNSKVKSLLATIGDDKNKTINFKEDGSRGTWKGIIPKEFITGEEIEIKFTAEDINGNSSYVYYSEPFKYEESKPIEKPLVIKIDNRPRVLNVNPKSGEEVLDTKKPEIVAKITSEGKNPKVTIEIEGKKYDMVYENGEAKFTPSEDFTVGKKDAKIVVTRSEDDVKSEEFLWSFWIGKSGLKHFYGQLHSHTNYSDGAGSLEDALEYAKNADTIDFIAITDHSNYFDTADNLGDMNDPTSGIKSSVNQAKSKWEYYKELINSYKTDDFLPIYGYEMTWTKSGANYGHINTYNTNGFVSRNNKELNDKSNSKGLLKYYDLLTTVDTKTFSQFNHPGTVFGNFDDFGHYTPEYDKVLKLVEVGNGEGKIGSNGYFRSYDEYQMALDKGWHLSPSNNQDNHKGHWGDANTARNVVIASDLTYDSIYDAIMNHRFYSTEDKNLKIDYSLNNQIMGSDLSLSSDVETLNINVEISDKDDTDVIGNVEIISNNGKVVASKIINSNVGTINLDIPNLGSFYYVKVTQKDGDIAVTSPVWTKQSKNTGIDSLTVDSKIVTVGTPITISSTFRNDEQNDIKATRILYIDQDTKEVLGDFNEEKIFKAKEKTQFSHDIKISSEGTRKILLTIYTDDDTVNYKKTIEVTAYNSEIKKTDIKDIKDRKEGELFMIEGTLTSNASGYDKNTAFFDSAYVQDETGGINIFPISGEFIEGQKVRIYGKKSSYQGESQINIDKIDIIDESINSLEPTVMKTGEVKNNTGLLIKTSGVVLDVKDTNGIIDSILIDDGSGEVKIFINGYIGRLKSEDKSMPKIKVGDTVSSIGLSSIDPEGVRIRTRNRSDIKVINKDKKDDENDKPNIPDIIDDSNYYPIAPIYPFDFGRKDKAFDDVPKDKNLPLDTTRKPEINKPSYENTNKFFSDVKPNDWFYDSVRFMVEKNLMNGISKDKFSPNTNLTRAMAITIIYRLAGTPQVKTTNNFSDVHDEYYKNAVSWGVENKIIKGIGNNLFAPEKFVTREELTAMLFRYTKLIGKDTSVNAGVDMFKDGTNVNDWAKESFGYAIGSGLINGYEDGTLKPQKNITRAEIAKIINKFIEK